MYLTDLLERKIKFHVDDTELRDKVSVTFRKTVQTRPYESEVYEYATEFTVPNMTSIERMLVMSALQIQLDYTAYMQLFMRGLITQEEFEVRKKQLDKEFELMHDKFDELVVNNVIYFAKE